MYSFFSVGIVNIYNLCYTKPNKEESGKNDVSIL